MRTAEFEEVFGVEAAAPAAAAPRVKKGVVDAVDLTRRLCIACEQGDAEVAMYLVDACGAALDRPNARGLTPLFITTQYRRLDLVRAMLRAGARVAAPNADGRTPLFAAAERGYADGAQLRVLVCPASGGEDAPA